MLWVDDHLQEEDRTLVEGGHQLLRPGRPTIGGEVGMLVVSSGIGDVMRGAWDVLAGPSCSHALPCRSSGAGPGSGWAGAAPVTRAAGTAGGLTLGPGASQGQGGGGGEWSGWGVNPGVHWLASRPTPPTPAHTRP